MTDNKWYALICLLLLLSGTGCLAQQQWSTPAGFAVYPDEKPLKSVSPDGVVYRVKVAPNKPPAALPFWKEALKKRMLDVGYIFQREEDIMATGKQGYVLELVAPVGAKDYAYLIAVFIDDGDDLIIIESAGEIMRFNSHHEDIISAIRTNKF